MMLVNKMFRDPKVENPETVRDFLTKNNFSTDRILLAEADTASATKILLEALMGEQYYFNARGQRLCNTDADAATCHGKQSNNLLAGKLDRFQACTDTSKSLQQILSTVTDLKGQPVQLADLPAADHYILAYWQIFKDGKTGYTHNIEWLERAIKADTSGRKITFIKVNADLQESWGMRKGGSMKLKLKKGKGKTMSMEIGDLPVDSTKH
jgi:hypothetical protein